MMDFSQLFNIKQKFEIFRSNHPKFVANLDEVAKRGFEENQQIAIAIRYKDGTEVKTGITLTQSDLEALNSLKNLL